ncbi:MAG: hypothetical protein ACYS8K_06580, partial [Planctomycetota bacterium]
MEDEDYRSAVRAAVRDQGFLRLTFSRPRGEDCPWLKVSGRPVEVGGRRQIQLSYFTPDRCITKNAAGGALKRRLKEALALPFSHIHVQASGGDLHVRITRKGKALVSRGKPSRPDEEPSLEHDRQKEHLLPAGEPDPFLQAVGIMTEAGEVRPSMQAKFRQVNEFLRVIEQMVAGKPWAE